MNDQNVELWEDSSGGIMLVADGKGFKGLERLWLLYVSQAERPSFETDAARFEAITEGGLYEPMGREEVLELYEREGAEGAPVNVASCERGYVDVWEAPKSDATTWYLGGVCERRFAITAKTLAHLAEGLRTSAWLASSFSVFLDVRSVA